MISKKVYIAPDGFVAFIDRAHPKHVQASAYFRYFAQEKYQLYTSLTSMNDTYTIIYNTISPALARDFLRTMSLSSVNIIYPESAEMKQAVRTVETSNAVDLTFSKALMSVVCNRKNIPQIATFEYLHSLFGLQVFYLPM
jgi:predicted nucleic acid-binding protein